MIVWDSSAGRIASDRPSEKKNEGLRLMNFVVDPTAGLLDTEVAPLFFIEQATFSNVAEDSLGKEHMSVFVLVVLILFRVLNFVWEVWHTTILKLYKLYFFIFFVIIA